MHELVSSDEDTQYCSILTIHAAFYRTLRNYLKLIKN